MQEKEVQVAAFEGGELKLFDPSLKAKEAVLALPLTRLVARMVRVENGADPVETALPLLKVMSPFPDDPLAVSCEKVFETEGYSFYIAAAMPESAADDIAAALDAAKLNVVRIDALAIGELRGAWGRINTEDGKRRLIRIKSPDCLTLFVLDGDHPVALRAVTDDAELKREELLLLLEAEEFGGPKELAETIELESSEASLTGVRDRSLEEGSLDVLPESWREVLAETRFKGRLTRNLVIAGGIWAVIMGVLFGVPVVYGYMTDYQKGLIAEIDDDYREVKAMRDRTRAVRKYSDRKRGALEMMKAVSDNLPEEITLSRFTYDRGEDLCLSVGLEGTGDSRAGITGYKDVMTEFEVEDEGKDGDETHRVFNKVKLGALTEDPRTHKQRMALELAYEEEEVSQ